MTSSEVTISPELAATWLISNHNLRFKKAVCDKYMRDIQAGNWKQNGETIKFDASGNLRDGQHRLYAVVQTGIPITSLVVHGISEDSIYTVDTGRKRLTSDVIEYFDGEVDATRLSAAVNVLARYERGSLGSSVPLTVSETREVLDRHPDLRGSVLRTKNYPKKLKNAYLVFIDYIGNKISPERAGRFMEKVKTGENMRAGDPALMLRNRVLGDSVNGGGGRDRHMVVSALYIKALNAALQDKEMKTLRFSPKHEFPSIVGFEYGNPINL